METKNINRVEIKINKILTDKETETKNLVEQIKTEEEDILIANRSMDDATAVGNLKAYQKAKADRNDKADAKEMHEKRLDTLKSRPLISAAEYEKAVTDIYEEMAELDNQVRSKLAKLADEMYAMGLELQEAQARANKALHTLQNDVYRNADRKRAQNGGFYDTTEIKQVNKSATINWAKSAKENYQYTQYTEHKVTE